MVREFTDLVTKQYLVTLLREFENITEFGTNRLKVGALTGGRWFATAHFCS
jgi:hypothetical protein